MKNHPSLPMLGTQLLVAICLFANTASIAQHNGPPVTGQAAPRVGGDLDSHGCKASAGYVWHKELRSCVRPWMTRAVTLQVAPERRQCTGMIETQCLLVRELEPESSDKQWQPLYADIAGFKHVPGKHYTLRVRKDQLENPPADTPDIRYTLLKVLP